MVTVTRGGVILSVLAALVGPLLAGPLLAAPAAVAAPPSLAGSAALAAPLSPAGSSVPVVSEPVGAVLAAAAAVDAALTVPQHAAAAPAPQPGGPPGGAPQPGPVDIFVEVSPSTVQPGYLVGIRASCRDNSVGATVVSDAFGAVGVQPQRGVLTAAPMVRERTRPGNYRVKLECRDGETASTMLQVVKKVPSPQPSRGPATGFGGGAGGVTGRMLLPVGAALTISGLVLAVVALRRPRLVRGAGR
ncbi:hypothetical protein [Micromonospora sp. WMMD964]|uniref:hypothetical protein n=1 Tax=Micromonospora sp. WMMD964 TaxID=3016091 RepID=UPI00249CCAD4|nr:hypothetical protein [Micromonospora sp. WMMD964]WFF04289.1 hypothetical protein O7616_15345 [Micromonospora sp. WMMD964]